MTATTNATHAPTPWLERPVTSCGVTIGYEIVAPAIDGGEGEPLIVARCYTADDMCLIVRAVNSHEALVAALASLVAAAERGDWMSHERLAPAREALALAERSDR